MTNYHRMMRESEEGGTLSKKRYGALDYAGYGGEAKRLAGKRARKQVEEDADESIEGTGGGPAPPMLRRRAMTRCVPHLDSGMTAGAEAGNELFCLDFAHGSCPDGSECTHRHQVPKPSDDANPAIINADFDIFGRKRTLMLTAWEREHGKKEDGANDLDNAGLHITNLRPPPRERSELCGGTTGKRMRSTTAALDDAVRKSFGVFGEIGETRVSLEAKKDKASVIIVYAGRACAEFAKEAMTGQGLTKQSPDILQVRWASATGASDVDGPAMLNLAPARNHQPQPAAPTKASPAPLPDGWVAVLDAASGCYYYYHAATKHTTWTLPTQNLADSDLQTGNMPAAEPGAPEVNEWVRYFDAHSQQPYWANTRTNEVTWDDPTSLLPAAEDLAR